TAPEEAAATPPEVENFAPLDEIMRLYNEFCDKLRPIVSINGERRKKISARFNEYGIDGIKTIFVQAAQSDFLCGGGERGWKADFDWLIDANNFQKVLEGKYDNDYRVSEKNPLRETRFYTENLPTNARPIPLSDTGQGFLFVPAQNGVIEMPFSSHEKMTEPRAAPYQRYRNKNGFNTMAVLQEMLDAEEFHGEEVAV
ncbi:MAG: hypothetical protein FWD19_05410, partial [Defluviitaleaceae bacterium]|nr:hypothetical protein [Defluviitaleaceae bacterium]